MRADRRRVLRALAALGGVSVSGCTRLSHTEWVPEVLSAAETLNFGLQRLITSRSAMAREYGQAELSPVFPSNGTRFPADPHYQAMALDRFRDWRLRIGGRVRSPANLSLEELRGLPARTQITRHDCVEGWSAIAKWKGARLSALLERVRPTSDARYVVFFCADPMDGAGNRYYESIDFVDALHPQTILAYEWNDQVLPIRYGAPVRLRVERQLGYKMPKYVMRIELVRTLADIGGGKGGYWEDRGYEWYAGI